MERQVKLIVSFLLSIGIVWYSIVLFTVNPKNGKTVFVSAMETYRFSYLTTNSTMVTLITGYADFSLLLFF